MFPRFELATPQCDTTAVPGFQVKHIPKGTLYTILYLELDYGCMTKHKDVAYTQSAGMFWMGSGLKQQKGTHGRFETRLYGLDTSEPHIEPWLTRFVRLRLQSHRFRSRKPRTTDGSRTIGVAVGVKGRVMVRLAIANQNRYINDNELHFLPVLEIETGFPVLNRHFPPSVGYRDRLLCFPILDSESRSRSKIAIISIFLSSPR